MVTQTKKQLEFVPPSLFHRPTQAVLLRENQFEAGVDVKPTAETSRKILVFA